MEKLFCFVDESGQDTQGSLFVVAIIITGGERDELEAFLLEREQRSRQHHRKWHRTPHAQKKQYAELALVKDRLKGSIFYGIHLQSTRYFDLTALDIDRAVRSYAASKHLSDFKVTIMVDGLNATEQQHLKKRLTRYGLKSAPVKGVKDEQSALVRLADAVAGIVRESYQGDPVFEHILDRLLKQKIVSKL